MILSPTTMTSSICAARRARPATSKARPRMAAIHLRALAAVSDASPEAGLRPYAVRGGRETARLQAVSATFGEPVAILHQPAGCNARTMHLLRLLRVVRLRQLF